VDAVAIYAAAVGTVGLGWQVVSQLRADRTKLVVSVGGSFDGAFVEDNHQLSASIVNESRHEIPMPGLEIFQPSIRRGWPVRAADIAGELPDTLRARDAVTLLIPSTRFVGMRLNDPVVAVARTATGAQFTSEPTVIGHLQGQRDPG